MVKIAKRDGSIQDFNRYKIINAVNKAFLEVDGAVYETDTAEEIAADIEKYCEKIMSKTEKPVNIEKIQDMVEELLMSSDRQDVARSYIRYRFKREIFRQNNKTYNQVLDLVEMKNEELNKENSNKDAIIASTQRDYMAGELSKDLTLHSLLPSAVVKAHKNGEIHFHDSDYFAQHIFNCCLVNLEDMLQNGTVINKTKIEKPHSFATACNIATQISAVVASGQYGGQSITLSHLAPFVNISRQKIRKELQEELDLDESTLQRITEKRLREEIKRGVQTIQYQINTLNTSNGQTPFITVFMYLNEVPEGQLRDDLALVIEEVLRQRIQGVKNEVGVWITPAFPKLIYVLQEDNIKEDGKYWYLTKLAAECSAKRLVPDCISEKIMKQLKLSAGEAPGNGDCYPCMGCRSFLTPDRSGNGFNNISSSGNYNPNAPKYYGRFNQGVVTINLVDVALTAVTQNKDFWEILDNRLELCHVALQERHKRLEGTISDISPVHWQYGALARLKKGETIDKLLHGGYSTISLGYAGLWECVFALINKKLTELEGEELGLSIMQKLNDACSKWKQEENIDYSLYGTPIESTTYKFAKCLKKKFGIIKGVTDKDYITNSYHVHVTEEIDAFSKIALEAKFQALSPGGAITYVEVPNLTNNIDAVLELYKFIYDNIIYAELNTKSDYCQVCDYNGEIEIVETENGELDWQCPNCGNMDHNKLNVARRTCGYIGSNFWNQGRTQEIKERALHL